MNWSDSLNILRRHASRSWPIKAAAVVAFILLLLLGLGILPVPAPLLATMLAALLVLFLPGFLLARLFWGRPQPLPERLALVFSLSVGLWSVPALLLIMLHSNLVVMTWVVMAITLLLTAAVLFHSPPAQATQSNFESMNPPAVSDQALASRDWPRLLYWLALVAALALILAVFATTASPFRGDRLTYQAFLRHFLDAEQFFARGFRISSDLVLRSARELLQIWLLLLALIIKLAQVDVLDAYVYYLPPLLILVSFSAFYALAKELFDSQLTVLTACLVQSLYYLSDVLTQEGIGHGLFLRIIEDKFLIRFILLPIALWLTLRYLKQGGKGTLVSLFIAFITLGLVHPLGLVLYGISLGSLLVVVLLFSSWPEKKERLFRVAPIAIAMLIVLLLPLWQRQQMASSAAEVKEIPFELTEGLEGPQGGLHSRRLVVLSAEAGQYISSIQLIDQPLVILAILLTPLLLKYVRTRLSAQFLFANMAGVLVLCYTPFITPLLGKVITPWLIWRVLWLLPVSLVISFFLGEATRALTNRVRQVSAQWLGLMPLGVVLVGAFLLRGEIKNGIGYLGEQEDRRALTTEERAVLTYLREHGTPGSVILTPTPQLSDEIPGLVGHSYGITFRNAPPLFDSAPEDRNRFFAAKLVTNTHLDILRQYDIRYVILEAGTELASQFKGLSSMFQLLYTNRDYVLYQWQPELGTKAEFNIIEGNTHFLQGDLAAAEKAYRQEPDHPLAAMGLGKLYLAEGKVEDALGAYGQAIAASPDDPWPRLYLATAYVAKGRMAEEGEAYEKAFEAYREAFALAPDNLEVRDGLVKAYALLGEKFFDPGLLSELIAAYEKDVELEPDSVATYWKLAEVYETLGRTDEATAVYEDAVERWPDRADAHLRLGNAYEAEGEVEAAIAEYKRAIDSNPRLAAAYIRLSTLYLHQGRPEEAIATFKKGARENPNEALPRLALGRLYLELGRVEEAVAEYQAAIQREPDNSQYYRLLAQAYKAQGMTDEAIAQYQTAIRLAEDYETRERIVVEAARMCLSAGDSECIEGVLEAALKDGIRDPELVTLALNAELDLFEQYQASGEFLKARARAWDVLALDPNNEAALEILLYYDFLDHLSQAQIDAPHEPFEHVGVTDFAMPLDGDQRRVLFMHPEARVVYQVELPSEPVVLWFSLAMSPESWGWGGDGVTFEVYLKDEAGLDRMLFSQHVGNEPEDRGWHDERVDLEPYAGQKVEITFVTEPGPQADYTGDLAGWATPRILFK